MKTALFFLLFVPFDVWAQADTLKPIRIDTLKVIGTELISGYGRYGRGVRTQYTYDGIDVRRPLDLEKYIRASGDVDAITELDRIRARRQSSWPLIILGSGLYIGGLIGIANAIDSDTDRRTITYSTLTYPYTQTRTVSSKGAGGLIVALVGVGLGTWGFSLRAPGSHFRRSVQYYNRSLRQRGISWHMVPYSSTTASGVGFIGKF